ncbi:hypothetical protein Z951_21350 [Streptomyces sp. PRh5]|nr:hypothetical protein Z951_21350 [Streptomyces sp. PRh5]
MVLCRSGAGGMPCSRRISRTVEAAILIRRAASSPWIRRDPHEAFSLARRRTRARIDRIDGSCGGVRVVWVGRSRRGAA